MDIISMKQDFYKRFDESDSYLYQQSCGLLCTLLGFPNITGALSITYPLSVGVKGLCRSAASDKLELESTDSDEVFSHRIHSEKSFLPKDKRIFGGQILIDNSIPKYFDSTAEVKCCTLKCVLSFNELDDYDKVAAAASCCGKENIKPYLALLNARQGYCIKSDRLKAEALPLPLSGFKIILIQLDKKETKTEDIKEIENEVKRIKTHMPHITAMSELNRADLETLRPHIRSKSVYRRLIHIINDNERIRRVSESLRSCRTSELFNQMNMSAKDFLKLWGLEKQEAMLLQNVLETEGVRAARFWNRGVAAIAYEERVDYILSAVENAFKHRGGYEIKFCVAK